MIKYTASLPNTEVESTEQTPPETSTLTREEYEALRAEMTETQETARSIGSRFRIYTHILFLYYFLYFYLHQTPASRSTDLYQTATLLTIICMYWYCARVWMKALGIEWRITRQLYLPIMAKGNLNPEINKPSLNELKEELESFSVSRIMHNWQQGILNKTFDTTFVSRTQFATLPLLMTDVITAFPYCIIMWALFIPTWAKLKQVRRIMSLEEQMMDEYEVKLQEAHKQLLAQATGK